MKSLADERSIVIYKANEGSAVVVWDRNDYFKAAQNNQEMKKFIGKKLYRKKNYKRKQLSELVDKSNSFF